MAEFEYRRRINYYETDKMGVVHHSNYIRFLEEARCHWMEAVGMPFSLLEKEGATIPVLEVNCKYKHHVTEGDVIIIKPKITEFNGVRMTLIYDVIEEKTGVNVIEAYTKHCFTNKELRPINLKKYNLKFYNAFENLLEKEVLESNEL